VNNFQKIITTLQSSIFSWDYFSNFTKISENTFKMKVQLNILNSLLGEQNIEDKFLELVKIYSETRKVLPLLIAVRDFDKQILNRETLEIQEIKHLFD
jgi:type II restriction enzyme